MNAKSVEEIAFILRGMRDARDRIPGYRALVVDVVRELSLGMPVAPERIAELAAKQGTPERTIEKMGHSAEWSDSGIVGLNGLTLGDSRHRLHFDEVTMGTWCAWDSLFLVPIIGRAARLESTSPATNVAVEVSITPEGVTGAEPATTVMSVVVPHPDTTSKIAQPQNPGYRPSATRRSSVPKTGFGLANSSMATSQPSRPPPTTPNVD
jgi:alkylmercury lyase